MSNRRNNAKFINLFPFFLIIFLIGIFSISCGNNVIPPNPDFISGHTGGTIGRMEPVLIEFNHSQERQPLGANAFTLQPSAAGSLHWENEYTLVFTPSEPFRPAQQYRARVNIDGIPEFSFEFMTSPPSFAVTMNSVRITGNDEVIVSGIVHAEADAEISQIQRTISSGDLGRPLWSHEGGQHRFTFNSVERLEASRTAEISWDGRALGSDHRGFTSVLIPGSQNFEMLDLRLHDGIIEVSFSSHIRPESDLRGFISLSGRTDLRYSLDGNIVRIFGDTALGFPPGTIVSIQDLIDVNGRRLAVPVQYTVPLRWDLPAIRFPGTGTILPTSQGAQLIIETRNLSGIIIEAFQIYDDNMMQFLQINAMSGERELDRVGQPVWTESFDLPWIASDQNQWLRHGLDISELSRRFPGGMFRIRVSFRPAHIHYECPNNHGDFSNRDFPDETFPPYHTTSEPSFWNFFNQNQNWTEMWNNRGDPCHPAFYHPNYNRDNIISRNVLVSDLGLVARRSLDGSWLIATSNIITARPSPNTDFSIYNFQGRLLHQGRTGSDGMSRIPVNLVPEAGPLSRLFIIAENSLGRAYLRVNDSVSLSVSHFDISGGSPASGPRGLIYGERGVWRPGDDIFLTFLFSDPQNSIPSNHPVNFELQDPMGRITLTRTYNSSVDGFYPIEASTPADAPTGDWIARVRVGSHVFTRGIKIETVMPNRLKMDLDFGEGDFISSNTRHITLDAEWLFGAPSPGLRYDVNVSFADMETGFSSFPDYSFRDPSRLVSSERQSLWEGFLDDTGSSVFELNLKPGVSVPGMVIARFMTRVFEPSGVFSSEQVSHVYSPYNRYTGIRLPAGDTARNMLLTDVDHSADIVVVDEHGRLFQGDVELSVAIYKLSWRWWWERGGGEAADIAATLSRSPISRSVITARGGRASWNFRIDRPDWGRYLVIVQDVDGGHAAAQIVYIDWPGWAGRPQEGAQGATLTLSAGEGGYNAGDQVEVSFPSNNDASALVVIEKGGEIIRSEWIQTGEGQTVYSFVAEPSMVPNVYVHVSLFQPHLQTQNDLPIRLYGIVPVFIDDYRTVLNPVITASDVWQAESTVSFTISEENGRPMAYTVAVVDEGLLGLTRFSLPNPRNTFYSREASFLRTWDLFNEVIGAYSGRLETLLAIGGGDVEAPPDTVRDSQRFRPVVRFFGPFEIGANESRTETFDLPPYIGALRIMVMAASSTEEPQILASQRAYGTAETMVRVTSDLMVFATLPRILSPGDEVEVPVFVNSLAGGSRNVRVSLSVPGAEIVGSSFQDIRFNDTGEQLIRFSVIAPPNPGFLDFNVIAESPGLRTANHLVEMEVRSTAIPVTNSEYTLIMPGESWEGTIYYPGRDGTNTLTVEFSRLPPINLESRLDSLISYPHGCIEQVTSGLFPQLYLEMMTDLKPERRAEIRQNINNGLERLYTYQLPSGGFSYWPGETIPHDWSSSYVGHFLIEARRLGYPVRESVIRNWLHYQRDRAMVWQPRNTSYSFTEQSYRLFTIALAGEAEMGSMNRLRSHWDGNDMTIQARWRLAAAYWHSGQRDIARNMVKELDIPSGEYRELSATFGSTLRDRAMILETLLMMGADGSMQGFTNEEINRTLSLFESITERLSDNRWLSTQETAFALIAIAPFIRNNSGNEALNVNYSVGGNSGSINFNTPSIEEAFGFVAGTFAPYRFTNTSSSPVYVKLSSRGIPDEGSERALSNGLQLTVEYRDMNGRILDPFEPNIGSDMEVIVRVRNTHGIMVEEIALVVPVPASWEIINTRLSDDSQINPGSQGIQQAAQQTAPRGTYRYQDIRDDRVMTYFNLERGTEITISFMVNLTYEGNFFIPAIHAYAMYDESIRALIPGIRR